MVDGRIQLVPEGVSAHFNWTPYEDLNDAERLRFDPAMRTVVGGRARDHTVASTSEVARFETETLSTRANLNRLMDHQINRMG